MWGGDEVLEMMLAVLLSDQVLDAVYSLMFSSCHEDDYTINQNWSKKKNLSCHMKLSQTTPLIQRGVKMYEYCFIPEMQITLMVRVRISPSPCPVLLVTKDILHKKEVIYGKPSET